MTRIKNFKQHLDESSPSSNSDYLNNIQVVVKGDKEAAELHAKVLGDGKEPNQFFVTISNDYMYMDENDEMVAYSDAPAGAPVKIEDHIEVETFGPFASFEDAKKKADNIDLSDTVGPRYLTIDDRKTGTIVEKFLKAQKKVIWGEESNDNAQQYGYNKK